MNGVQRVSTLHVGLLPGVDRRGPPAPRVEHSRDPPQRHRSCGRPLCRGTSPDLRGRRLWQPRSCSSPRPASGAGRVVRASPRADADLTRPCQSPLACARVGANEFRSSCVDPCRNPIVTPTCPVWCDHGLRTAWPRCGLCNVSSLQSSVRGGGLVCTDGEGAALARHPMVRDADVPSGCHSNVGWLRRHARHLWRRTVCGWVWISGEVLAKGSAACGGRDLGDNLQPGERGWSTRGCLTGERPIRGDAAATTYRVA